MFQIIPRTKTLGSAFVIAGVANLLSLSPSLFILSVYDRVLMTGDQTTLAFLVIFVVITAVLSAYLDSLKVRLCSLIGNEQETLFASQLYRESLRNDGQAYSDWQQVRGYIFGFGLPTLLDLPWCIVYASLLFAIDPTIGSIAMICMLLLGALQWSLASEDLQAEDAYTPLAMLVRDSKNVTVAKAMGYTNALENKWLAFRRNTSDSVDHYANRKHIYDTVSKAIRILLPSLVLAVGSLHVIEGMMTGGIMIAASLMVTRFVQPIDTWISSTLARCRAQAAWERISKITDNPAPGMYLFAKPGLSIEKVSYMAPGGRQILNDMTFSIPGPGIITLVGPNGAGKSTLAQLLVGLIEPSSGSISIGGQHIQHLNPTCVGYMPQQLDAFHGSLMDVIGRHQANIDHVIEAATLVGLHEIALRLPQGYDTPAHKLSGGLKQRVALARAIYSRPALLVLDEPNAHLDQAGEAILTNVLQALRGSSTIVVITQRAGILAVADAVLVIEEGQLKARLAHDATNKLTRVA